MQSKKKFLANPYAPLLLIAGFYLLQLLSRLYLQDQSVFEDDTGIRLQAKTLSLGYPLHLPLYNWIAFFINRLDLRELVALNLIRFSLLFTFAYAMFNAAFTLKRNHYFAFAATLSLGLTKQLWLNKLTHANLALCACGLVLLCFIHWCDKENKHRQDLALLGFALAFIVTLLSKFSAWGFLALFLYASYRSLRVHQPQLVNTIIGAFALSLVCINPYLYWFSQHYKKAIGSQYKVVKTSFSLHNAMSIPGKAIELLLFFLIIYGMNYAIELKRGCYKQAGIKEHVFYQFSLHFFKAYALVVLLLAVTGHVFFHLHYHQPFLFFMPLFCLFLVKDAPVELHQRFCFIALLVLFVKSIQLVQAHPNLLLFH